MNRRAFIKGVAGSILLSSLPVRLSNAKQERHRIWLTYSVELPYEDTVRLWVPVPMNTDYQQLLSLQVEGSYKYIALTRDKTYKAPILYAEFEKGNANKKISVSFEVEFWERDRVDFNKIPKNNSSLPEDIAFFLKPTQHIQTDGIVKEYADRITKGKKSDLDKVRAIYEWVVENTFRDPRVLGCGVGDVKSMLETGYFGGKCTDINSLFVALCRASGIPARELFGIRVLPSKLSKGISSVQGDATKAQHCRAEFYLGRWIPADPADVRKLILEEKLDITHPKVREVRDFMFGGWDTHWIAFNYARDFMLEPPTSDKEPINEFMYPIAEVGGKQISKYKLTFEHSKYSVKV